MIDWRRQDEGRNIGILFDTKQIKCYRLQYSLKLDNFNIFNYIDAEIAS